MMRSSHCPNLVRIESNANFLSRFQSVATGMTKIDTSVGIEFYLSFILYDLCDYFASSLHVENTN